MSDSGPRPPNLNGCRVSVFLDNTVSGATLGYYGTVLGPWRRGWFLVSVPALRRVIAVEARDLLVVQSSSEGNRLVTADDSNAWFPGDWQFEPGDEVDKWHVAERRWEIEFEMLPQADNSVLRGKYSIGSVAKGRFKFEKANLPAPTYLFRMPATTLGSTRGKLSFKVPASHVLDRAYVMKTLAELLDQSLPTDVEITTA